MFSCGFEQLFWIETQAPDRGVHSGPVFLEKFLAFAFEQEIARAIFNEHPEATSFFDQFFVHQLLVSFEHRERIHAVISGDIPHRWQRVAFFEHTVENHMHDAIAKLAINRLMIIPFTIHSLFQTSPSAEMRRLTAIDDCASYGVVVNYNTRDRKSVV